MKSYPAKLFAEYIYEPAGLHTSSHVSGRPLTPVMAEAVLNQVNVVNMFDLRGVVAVVTGGGSVSLELSLLFALIAEPNTYVGHRVNDEHDTPIKWCYRVHHRTSSSGSRQVRCWPLYLFAPT